MPREYINNAINAYKSYKDNPEATRKIFENQSFSNAPDFIKGFTQMNTDNTTNSTNNKEKAPLINYKNPAFIKGLLLGAGLAYIATNKTVQQAVISTSVRLLTSVQGSFEEMKEQIQDVKAELSNEK